MRLRYVIWAFGLEDAECAWRLNQSLETNQFFTRLAYHHVLAPLQGLGDGLCLFVVYCCCRVGSRKLALSVVAVMYGRKQHGASEPRKEGLEAGGG